MQRLKTIKVRNGVWEWLMIKKIEWRLDNISEVIEKLIKYYEEKEKEERKEVKENGN